jgi:hypothetical protein
LASSCSDPANPPSAAPDGGAPPATDGGDIDSFYDSYARAVCDRLFDCSLPNDDDLVLRNLFGTPQRCVELGKELLVRIGEFEQRLADAQQATIRYDRTAAAACWADLRRCGGPEEFGQIRACREMFEGSAAEGSPCRVDDDCAGDAYCANPDPSLSPTACPGVCRARKPNGATCFFAEECSASKGFAACRATEGGRQCADYAMAAAARAGQSCGLSEAGTLTPCGSGAWCDRTNTCRAALASGEACASTDDVCATGLLCQRLDGGSVCSTMQVAKNAGEACSPVSSAVCDPFLSLECVSGACALTGDGSQGSHCRSADFGQLTCQRGLGCNGTTKTCQPLAKAGEACQSNAECESHSCNGSTCNARLCSVH